jgi:hypothetical protein
MVAMRILSRPVVAWLQVGLIVVVVSACATAGDPLTPSASFTTLSPGWESKFKVEWNADPEQAGTRRLRGQITNHYGVFAESVSLLGQALDSSGNVVSQRIERVPGGVPGYSPVYFEIDRLAVASSYRVTVWYYTTIEGRGTQQ